MAAGACVLYQANLDDINLTDLVSATVKLALVSSAYSPNFGTSGNDDWADVSANEIANGNGYTTGGYTLGTLAKTAVTGGWKFSSGNAAWTASGGSIPAWRYGVLYVSGSLWGLTNPLLCAFLGDSTPADVPATAAGFVLTAACPANGWFDVTT